MDDLLPPRFETNHATELRPSNEEEFEAPSTSKKLLVFFAIPVAAGLLFENGASITVDLILIGLACLCLYWSVEIPWQWYFYARTLALEETAHSKSSSTAVESSDDEHSPRSEEHAESAQPDPKATEKVQDKPEWRTLHSYELNALAACFLAPPVTAYILHRIREYLARPDGSPIENASFVLFVMAAELPPLNQACKLLFAHTMYLQRVVANYDLLEDDKVKELKSLVTKREDDHSKAIDEMSKTIADLQARLASPSPPSGSKTPPAESRQAVSTQNQVDALNRAVRRYEKRAITQSIVYEARIKDLEARINDALTLAAAASRSSSQNAGVFSWIFDVITWLVWAPLHLLIFLFTWPVTAISDLYRFLLGPRRKKKKNDKGKNSEGVFARRQRIEDR